MRERPAPVGRYHDHDRCHWCGVALHASGPEGLQLVVVRDTHAWGWRCVDPVACARRRHGEKQLALFGAG